MDSFSSVTFRAPFEPDKRDFREVFKPFTFKPLEIRIEQSVMFTGTLVDVAPDFDADSSEVVVTAYSLPAVLGDCTAQGEKVPHEFKKIGFEEIAKTLAAPFGIRVRMLAEGGSVIDKAKLDTGEKIFEFLIKLAQQRSLILSSTPEGELLCWRSVEAGNPRARIMQGEQPLVSIKASFSPQDYFSEITGFASEKRRKEGSRYTARNPWLTTVIRPFSFRLDDTERGDAPAETKNKLARMFGNMASWSIEDLPTWRDPQGDLWEPNTTILVTAPKAMIYRETELLIRTVRFKQSAGSYTADLEVVLPGAFSGDVPKVLPWDD
jgi:prophage tail gpP-like protein